MAHDGQDFSATPTPVLSDLTDLTAASIAPLEALLEAAKAQVRSLVERDGRVRPA